MSIEYINDKKRMYIYDILSKQQKLNRKEKNEFEKLKRSRIWDELERREILEELNNKGYIYKVNDDCIRNRNGVRYHGGINLVELNVTELGKNLLQKELRSELKEGKYRKLMEWLDRLVNFKFLVGAIVGFLLQEILSLLKGLVEWIIRVL